MKKLNIWYWISTVIAAGVMAVSAWPDAMLTPGAHTFMTALGFPDYFTRFLGVAKLLGVLGILLPLPQRLKEWAYAGLCFDLLGASYCIVAAGGFQPQELGMLIFIAPVVASYVLYIKKMQMVQAQHADN